MSVRDRKSPRYDRVIRNLSAEIRGTVTVGIHAAEGSASHGSMTVAEIGEIHEFGTERIPARSFIGAWFDERQAKFPAAIRAEMEAAARSGAPMSDAFQTLAVTFQADVQKRIADAIPPPLADSTIRRKGSSVPLIDTGHLRSAILGRYEPG